ncbi:MAG TPA: hypothetical protein VMS75_07795 [Terriglobales bacterium]|nr:hypothetical protein [Terriglobales bacterium]
MKFSQIEEWRLRRAIRRAYQLHADIVRSVRQGLELEARPKLGGRAFRKRRTFHAG